MSQIPVISIIVPVYGVEKYLRDCLDSIVSQTFSDWECILVDDGSPDQSGAICDEYAARDSRFRVIHRPNGGVAAARNTALAACRGRYIGFVDSDDLVHSGMFQHLYELIVAHDADVAQVGFEVLHLGYKKYRPLVDSIEIYNRSRVAVELLQDKRIQNYLWNKLFRRELIDVGFPVGKVYEDMYAITLWARNIRKMVASPAMLYSYRQRKGSITTSFINLQNRLDYMRAVMFRARTFREMEPDEVTEPMVNLYLWSNVVMVAKEMARHDEDPQSRLYNIRQISDFGKTVAAPKLKHLGLKRWMRAKLLRISPVGFIRIIRIRFHKSSPHNEFFD